MLIHNKNFNLKQIAESGQCFRMNKIDKDKYNLIAFGKYLELNQVEDDLVELSCGEDDYELRWKEYFDLEYDYSRLAQRLMNGTDSFLKAAAGYAGGIRILKQDFFEVMISFIISQNKNIPAIKSCIEALCRRYGRAVTGKECGDILYYGFPAPDILAKADRKELRELKIGYRDEYIISASQAVVQGSISPDYIKKCGYEEAYKALRGIRGIGEKVASCICLYGLHHIGAFPVDVWIKRVLNEVYHGKFDINRFEGCMGIVQQYMFYYMRSGRPIT